MANLPEPAKRRLPVATPDLMRAAVSPTAAVLTAAGAGIGVLDHSWPLAVALAVVGWGGRMSAALVARARRRRAARPTPPVLDPWSVPEPWRQLVAKADSARVRFDQVVAAWPAGPMRDRLVAMQPLVWEHVGEVGVLARRGAAADGWNGAAFTPVPGRSDDLAREIRQIQREKVRFAGSERSAQAEHREAALAAELRDLRRQEEASQATRDRLRASVNRLDSTIADLVSVEPASARSVDLPDGVAGALDDLSDRLSSLQSALSETTEAAEAAGDDTDGTASDPGQGTQRPSI